MKKAALLHPIRAHQNDELPEPTEETVGDTSMHHRAYEEDPRWVALIRRIGQ